MKISLLTTGINCDRFSPKIEIKEKLTAVLSLCQSDLANIFIEKCCKRIGVTFSKANKVKENKWEIEDEINKADLVIGIGRSLYDAMACGRAVISYDKRYGQNAYEGDGYLNAENIEESLKWNCTGRGSSRMFIEELKKYRSCDGLFMREFALAKLNIRHSVEQYLEIYNKYAVKREMQIIKNYKLKFKKEMERRINNSSKPWRVILRKIKRFVYKFLRP